MYFPRVLHSPVLVQSSLKKTYIYADGEILAQHDGNESAPRYFYLHDRLGSVRQIIDTDGDVVKQYTYSPFGQTIEESSDGSLATSDGFMFTGQYYDSEIDEYYLRARQYDPHIGRFISRDPVRGKPFKPLTLHVYLYCGNNPINYIDPDGRIAFLFGGSFSGNITASDLSSGFNNKRGLGGIGAMVAHYSVILPAMTMLSDHFGAGGTAGAGVVVAWDHTKHFNDRDAWSWGSMQWAAAGASVATGIGGSITLDIGISNARHVSQLSGRFEEVGGSGTFGNLFTLGGTLSWCVNPDGSYSDIWLGTLSFGGGTSPGGEVHGYLGNAWVQEYKF